MTEEQRQRWNAAVASGNQVVIKAIQAEILDSVFTAIMDDDPNYAVAGWEVRPCSI